VWASVILDSTCVVCRTPGAHLCSTCRSGVAEGERPRLVLDGVPVYALGWYTGTLRDVIRAAKNFRSRAVLRTVAPEVRNLTASLPPQPAVPIPPSRAGFRRRGYGLAPMIARMLGRPVLKVLRLRDAGTQQGRSAAERTRQRTMTARQPRVSRVILVDDVLTTGASMRAAIGALSSVNCEVVAIVVLAVVPSRGAPHSICT
jgi:predicted amidophosphoribosyltransferase